MKEYLRGNLTSIGGSGLSVAYSRRLDNRIDGMTFSNGVNNSRTYDADGRLAEIAYRRGGSALRFYRNALQFTVLTKEIKAVALEKMTLSRHYGQSVVSRLRPFQIILLVVILCSSVGCSNRMDYHEAERQGELALIEYCAQEKLARTDFGGANVRPEDKYDWSIEYQSTTHPKHSLVLYFKKNKLVERHRLVE